MSLNSIIRNLISSFNYINKFEFNYLIFIEYFNAYMIKRNKKEKKD